MSLSGDQKSQTIQALRARITHLEKSLRHIANTCVQDPDVAQFALRAAENPPSAFPPDDDILSECRALAGNPGNDW